MKHVRRMKAEPAGLSAYRAASPAEEARPPEEATAVWEGFRADTGGYKELLKELAFAQQGLCIYCEQRLVDAAGVLVSNDYQAEHVLPKSGGPGRTLAWTNLALACGGGTYPHHGDPSRKRAGVVNTSCGQTKDDGELPPGCDPRSFSLVHPPAQVGLDGRVAANPTQCQAQGIAPADLTCAIERVLNLNCERLRTARQSVGDNIRDWIVAILEVLTTGHLTPDQRRSMSELAVAGRLQPDDHGYLLEFWTTERCALGAMAESWVRSNSGMFT